MPLNDDVRKELSRWKWIFFQQKYRFDLGHQFLAVLNFALLVIAASDKLRYYTGVPRTWMLILIAIPLGFFGMWLLGYFLDNVVRYGQAYSLEQAKRNPSVEENRERLKRIEELLLKLEARS